MSHEQSKGVTEKETEKYIVTYEEGNNRRYYWIKIHDEKFQELYSPATITHVIKSRRMRWAGHVEHVREEKGIHGIGEEI